MVRSGRYQRRVEMFMRHRTETVAVNPATETRPVPEHDMLEVNHYLMSGLVVSSIDKWFMGPIPQFSPEDLGVLGDKQDLQSALNKAHTVASDPTQMAWQAVGSFYYKVNDPEIYTR